MKSILTKAVDGLVIFLVGYKLVMPHSTVAGLVLLAVGSLLVGQALGDE